MSYAVRILRRAQKELGHLPDVAYEQIRAAIYSLGEEPRPRGCRKLAGREGWRIRIGKYRIIYDLDNKQHVITILHIGHRRDVYR